MDTKGLQKEFINWCKSKNKLPKSEDETKQLFIAFMKEKHPEEYKAAMENQLKQAQKALHGAKLNYFRTLKNQCAEDEEVVYYKKGGSVNCGCKKKEEGGEVKKAGLGCSAVERFKSIKKAGFGDVLIKIADSLSGGGFKKAEEEKRKRTVSSVKKGPGTTKQPTIDGTKKMLEENKKKFKNDYSSKRVKDSEEDYLKGKTNEAAAEKCGGKVKKHQEGSVIAKFKAYRKGGSLNGIPFYLKGISKVGRFGDGDKLPTARKAEERYANSTFLTTEHPLFSTSMRFNPKAYHEGILQIKPAWNYRPAWIAMEVIGNDTTYRERPEQKMGFNRTVIRQASNSDSDKSEYKTLLRRFNTAKGIATKKIN